MSNLDIVKGVYEAFAAGDVQSVLSVMHPQVHWTETAGYKYGGEYEGPEAVVEHVLARIPEDFDGFQIEVDRFVDGGDVVVMQGHYVATAKATGRKMRAAVAHALELADGKIVRFDQYLDSATANAALGE